MNQSYTAFVVHYGYGRRQKSEAIGLLTFLTALENGDTPISALYGTISGPISSLTMSSTALRKFPECLGEPDSNNVKPDLLNW